MADPKLRIIPLGGLGEIGCNMMVVEYDDNLIVVDAGLMFPDNDMLGIDIVIPDFRYVVERADKLRAIIITHGHEDHIGALPYLLARVQAPVYATRLTRGLIEVKLAEAGVSNADLHTINSSDVLALPPFRIEFFHVCHSIPDGLGLAIDTPAGLIVHSGDFKLDPTPVDGRPTEFGRLEEIGARGVLLLLSDSTNAEKPGTTPSEQVLGHTLERVFAAAEGRVIVATFASNISRVQQVMDTAHAHGRRLAVVGSSMVHNVRIARELGYLTVPDGLMLPVDDIDKLPDHNLTVICTGSQGEPTSALVRMSNQDSRAITVHEGDTIVVSATSIPGNEEMINRTLNNLFRLGADVLYDDVLDVHVSGHASQEEQKTMIRLIQPKFFVPIHGEYRHLVLHGRLAEQCGVTQDRVIIMETGDVLELNAQEAEIVDHISDTPTLVDGLGVGDIEQTVLDDRRALAADGFIVVVIVIDKYTGGSVNEPQLITRGFVHEVASAEVLAQGKQLVMRQVQLGGTRAELIERVRSTLQRFAFDQTGRRPIIVPVINKV